MRRVKLLTVRLHTLVGKCIENHTKTRRALRELRAPPRQISEKYSVYLPVIQICSNIVWVLHSPVLHPSVKFHEIQAHSFYIILLTHILNRKHNILGGSNKQSYAVKGC